MTAIAGKHYPDGRIVSVTQDGDWSKMWPGPNLGALPGEDVEDWVIRNHEASGLDEIHMGSLRCKVIRKGSAGADLAPGGTVSANVSR